MRTQALVVLMAVLAAPGGGAQELEVPRSGALDLEAVAAALDPGPQDPIGAVVSDWLLQMLPQDEPDVAAAPNLLGELRTLTFGGVAGLETPQMLYVVRAFLTLEAAVVEQPDVAADAALELLGAYGALASLRGLEHPVARIQLEPLLRRLARGMKVSPQRWQELMRLLQVASRRGQRLFARLAANLLRRDLDAAPRARLLLAVAFGPEVDRDTTVRCAERALDLLGATADATAWLRLSRCYVRGRDIPRAEAALQRSQEVLRQRAAESERSLADVLAHARAHHGQLELGARLAEIRQLQGRAEAGEGLEAGLARAALLERMDDEDAAELAYRALRDAYPHDARPVARLAQNAFAASDPERARSYLGAARNLRNRDTLFHFMSLLLDVLPKLSKDMDDAEVASVFTTFEEHVVAIAAAEPAWGEVLRHLRSVGVLSVGAMERPNRLFARFGERFPAVEQTWRRHPEQLSAYRLVLAFAPFCPNRGRAQRTLLRPMPEGSVRHPDLARWRAQSYLTLALAGDGALDQEAFDGLLDDLVRFQQLWFDALLLRGTGLAAVALRGDAEENWQEIAAVLRRALPPMGYPRRALAFNNWGLALLQQGEQEQALEAWARAMAAGDPDGIARLNLAIANARRLAGDEAAPWRRQLEQIGAAESLHPALRAQAWTWVGWLAERDGRQEAATTAFRAAVRTLDEARRATLLSPFADDGVHAAGETRWGLAVDPDGELKLIIYTDAQLWLLQAAPLSEAELRRKAR